MRLSEDGQRKIAKMRNSADETEQKMRCVCVSEREREIERVLIPLGK